jgi:hypothetical protein
MLPPANEADRANFEFVFPRVTKYMQVTLRRAAIITGNERPPQAQAPTPQKRTIEDVARDAEACIEQSMQEQEETRRQLEQLAAQQANTLGNVWDAV